MAFTIVHPDSNQVSWVPVLAADICYIGQLVSIDIATPLEGVSPMPVAAGHNNTTNKDVPMGVVIGMNATAGNLATSTTYSAQQITAEAAGAAVTSTTQFRGVEGPWSRGDKLAMVKIHHIDATTILRAPLFDTTYGTAHPPVLVTTASGADGLDCITAAATVATVANFGTIYVRTGANMGLYRTLTSASDTTHTWLQAMIAAVAVNDSVMVVNGLRPYGPCKMQIDAEAMFIDTNAALTSHNFWIHVRRLDLSVAGKEYVEFRFDTDNFCAFRA